MFNLFEKSSKDLFVGGKISSAEQNLKPRMLRKAKTMRTTKKLKLKNSQSAQLVREPESSKMLRKTTMMRTSSKKQLKLKTKQPHQFAKSVDSTLTKRRFSMRAS